MQIKFLTILLITLPLSATTLSQLIDSGLRHNSVIKKTELQIELMEAKQQESRAKKFGEIDIVEHWSNRLLLIT